MSFSRISTLALALAAGLAAPASAVTVGTLNVTFFDEFGGSAGSGFAQFDASATLPTPLSPWTFSFALYDGPDGPFNFTFSNGTTGGDGPSLDRSSSGAFYLNGANLAGTGPNNPVMGISAILFSDGTSEGIWALGTSFEIACPEEDDILTLSTSEDGPTPCFQSWFGSYTLTEVDPVDPGPEEPSVIPLPATAALLPLGLVALGAIRRRKKG